MLLVVLLGVAAGLRVVLRLLAALLLLGVRRLGVGVLAELVAVAEVLDHLPGEPREGALVLEHALEPLEGAPGVAVEMPAPEVHHVLRALRQRPPGGEMPHQIARRLRQRCPAGVGDLGVSLAPRLLGDLGVDVAGGARHRPRPHRLAARGLHRLEERRGGLALGRVAAVGGVVVEAQAQREGVGGAARQQHLVAGQPPRHLRQPHRPRRAARRVDREGDLQLALAGHGARRLRQRLLERIGRVVGGLGHGTGRYLPGDIAQVGSGRRAFFQGVIGSHDTAPAAAR